MLRAFAAARFGGLPGTRAVGTPEEIEEVRDLACQPLRFHPQLDQRLGFEQARVGHLLGQHAGVGEGVHGVAAMAQDQGRSGEGFALLAMWRDAPEEESLQQRSTGAGFLAHEVEHHVPVVGEQSARHRAGGARKQLHRGLAEGECDEQRGEGQGAAEQAVVEHRHLDHQPLQSLGVGRGDLEGGVGAQRGPHHDRLLDAQVVHQGDDLASVGGHRVAPHVAGSIGVAMPEQVEGDHAVAPRGEVFGQRTVHLLGEQEAVQEDQRP